MAKNLKLFSQKSYFIDVWLGSKQVSAKYIKLMLHGLGMAILFEAKCDCWEGHCINN